MKTNTFHTILSNGLTVIGEINQLNKSCGLGYFVKTGSRDESASEAGISHFLEHMMFKGTSKRSAIEVNCDLGNIGAQANAFTSDENTVYYSSIIPEYFNTLLELLSDMLRPSLEQNEFDTEKNVILEEIALYQDKPHFYLYECANRAFFPEHELGNSVLGTTESVGAISSSQMKNYFQRKYSPNNMVLVASGNFNKQEFLELAENYTQNWTGVSAPRIQSKFNYKAIQAEFKKKNLKQAHILCMLPSCSFQDQDRYAMNLLSVILGDGTGSKLYWELVNTGLAENAYTEQDEKDGLGVFSVFASTTHDKLDLVSQKIKQILDQSQNFTDEDLDRAKAKLTTRIIMGGELPMGRLMSLGMSWNYMRVMHNLESEIEKYKSVSSNSVKDVLSRLKLNQTASELSEFRLV